MRQIRAAVCRAFGAPLTIEEINIAPPGSGEIAVDLSACAICHSDILFAEGAWGGSLPAVFGHEAAGRVTAVGAGVTRIAVGDPVVVTLIRACGSCPSCAVGRPVTCEETFPLDRHSPLTDANDVALTHGLRTGAFAEAVVVEASQAVVIPESLGLDSASLLACGVITGVGAVVNTASLRPGQSAVIVGAGGVGLNAVQGAAIAGASMNIAVDLADDKLAAAVEFGATHSINSSRDDLAATVGEVTGGRGADFVFVTVSAKPAFDQSYGLLAPGGSVVLVGMPASGVMSEIDPGTLAAMGQRVLGSKMGNSRISVDIPWLVDLYQQGRLKLDELITGRYALDDINEAIASVKRGEALRNVIVF